MASGAVEPDVGVASPVGDEVGDVGDVVDGLDVVGLGGVSPGSSTVGVWVAVAVVCVEVDVGCVEVVGVVVVGAVSTGGACPRIARISDLKASSCEVISSRE